MSDIDLVKKVRVYAEEAEKNGFEVLTVPLRDLFPLLGRMEAAERERDELKGQIDSGFWGKMAAKNLARAKKAEAELARRDAAACEPVAWKVCAAVLTNKEKANRWAIAERHDVIPLYTAAPPAVLPPKLSMDIDPELQGEFRVHEAIRRKGFNQALDEALKLGAQQQKVVDLPMPFDVAINLTRKSGDIEYIYHEYGENFDRDEILATLDAANVKYEVKK